jgi:hypothetical protein
MNSYSLFITLLFLFAVLNVLDGHSTFKVIKNTSINNEKNPVARFIFKRLGSLAGIIVLKSILIPLILLMLYYFSFQQVELNVILILANFFYLSVVIHNYNVVKRVKEHKKVMAETGIDAE